MKWYFWFARTFYMVCVCVWVSVSNSSEWLLKWWRVHIGLHLCFQFGYKTDNRSEFYLLLLTIVTIYGRAIRSYMPKVVGFRIQNFSAKSTRKYEQQLNEKLKAVVELVHIEYFVIYSNLMRGLVKVSFAKSSIQLTFSHQRFPRLCTKWNYSMSMISFQKI